MGDLETILGNTPFLLAQCSRDLRYLHVSKGYATNIGRMPDEIVGKRIIDIMGAQGFETIRPYVEKVLQGQWVEYEAEFHIVNLGPRHFHVTYAPERDEQSEVISWIASIIDITEHKKDADERTRLERQLTHMERVAALGELSGGIAHELGQPLTAILANAQAARALIAAKDGHKEEIAEMLEDIIQDDSRASEVIQRLRRLFKNGDRESILIDLNDKVRSTLGFLHSEIANRKITVETDLKTDLPLISGDRVQLQQVLLNLIMNAMEAMASVSASQRMLRIGTRTTEGYVEVSITDSGPGMSPDQLKQIFEPYFTTKEQGLGLGLSIASKIVRSHRGNLTLSNAPHGGVTAVVSLPLSQ